MTKIEVEELLDNNQPAKGAKKRLWRDTNEKDWLSIYRQYMQERPKRQPKPMGIPPELGKNVRIGRNGIRDNTDSIQPGPHGVEESDDQAILKPDEDIEDVPYLNYELHTDGKNVIDKVKRENLRYNTLKLLKHSNISLFKWKNQYFMCYHCKKAFKDMTSLRCHSDRHSNDQIVGRTSKYHYLNADITDLECTICYVMLNSLNELENHLRSHNVIFNNSESLLIPYKLCSDSFTCQLCQNELPTKCHLMKHTIGHFLNYICPECNIGFRDPQSLKTHNFDVHCRKSNDISNTTLKNVKHKFNDGTESDLRFKCSHCPQKFRYDYKRIQHLVEEHSDESILFQCEFCTKVFMTVHWLTKHMNCVHPEELYK